MMVRVGAPLDTGTEPVGCVCGVGGVVLAACGCGPGGINDKYTV